MSPPKDPEHTSVEKEVHYVFDVQPSTESI